MGKVVFDTSMSLDGYMTASNRSVEEPLGAGGDRLHDWMADERGGELLANSLPSLGAVVAGRRTYDDSLPWWGADGPTGPARLPLFVVTHKAPASSPEKGVYRFVTDGIERALRRAQEAANGKDVAVMGGASLGQQYLASGLVDEIQIHLVPVLLGGGVRMFDNLGAEHIELESREVVESPSAVHLRFRVRR